MSSAPIRGQGPYVLRASAIRVKLDDKKAAKKQAARKQEWQEEAWLAFDDVPEVKNLMWFLGNAMSKLKLFVAVRPDDDPNAAPIPATDPESGIPISLALRAQHEIDRLKGPLGGRSEICREANMNLEIAGECYLVGRGPRNIYDSDAQKLGQKVVVGIEPEAFDIKSTREVDVRGEGIYYVKDDPTSGEEGVKLDENLDTIVRIYQRHPGASALADCHMRGVLSECELLTLLTNELKAESKSRQSSGFMTIANELSIGAVSVAQQTGDPDDDGEDLEPNEGNEGGDAEEATADSFEEALMNAIVAPIEDPAAPESVYPLLIRGPGEWLHPDFLRHFSIARDTTQLIESRIEARVMRLARGLNAPVEATMGHQATTFANAFQVDEDTFDDHLEPRCVLLCDALTVGHLIPNLLEANAGDPTLIDRLIVWYDAGNIIKRVDPVDKAKEAFDSDAISWEAYRNYNGFSEDDAPEPIEVLFKSILDLRRVDPNLVDAIINEMDPTLNPPPPVQAAAGGLAVDPRVSALQFLARMLAGGDTKPAVLAASAKVAQERESRPSRQLAAIDTDLRSKILAAADRSLERILERAGSRIKAAGVQTSALLKSVAPRYAVATLGRELVAAAGFHDEQLVGDDAWTSLEAQYRVWVSGGQARALRIVQSMTTLTKAQVKQISTQQSHDLNESWDWLADQLHTLAIAKLYKPDVDSTPPGEFDPTVRVPAGMIRQALARAGGARSITPLNNLRAGAMIEVPSYVANEGDKPLGGVGTGTLVSDTLSDAGGMIEAYEWDYGPAYRKSPFEDHEALDGEVFASFDSDVLAAGDWIGDYYFPGDHDGCCCDFVATWAFPEDLADDDAALSGDDSSDVGGAIAQAVGGAGAADEATADDTATAIDEPDDTPTVTTTTKKPKGKR